MKPPFLPIDIATYPSRLKDFHLRTESKLGVSLEQVSRKFGGTHSDTAEDYSAISLTPHN
jgi:hypothetical protein